MYCRLVFLIVLFSLFLIHSVSAEYEIKGHVNISPDWQYQIFLSTINKLDDYYNAKAEDIIQVGNIEQDGSFSLKGENLPLESRFYRLYLIKEQNSEFDACLYVSREDHNFIHLILDNFTKIEIQAEKNHFAPFGNYELQGDEANKKLRDLSMMIYPSFYFYQIKFPSELQFSEQKLNRDLFNFADSCDQVLVSLAAILNTDMDNYFDLESQKYLDFGNRLSVELNNHGYTDDYFRKMNYYNGGSENAKIPLWIYFIITTLMLGLIATLYQIYSLKRQLKEASNPITNASVKSRRSFTKQEEKILTMILDEKSNKEIASELFIELSTVKTHINKLYGKLGVKNRSEAKLLAKTLQD